jgi:hypothetical protein
VSLSKQELQDRVVMINNEMLQLKSNYNKLEGHLAETNHWLMEVIKKEAQEQVDSDKEKLDGQANNNPEEQAASEELCRAEGEEVPNAGQEPCGECESESAAAV